MGELQRSPRVDSSGTGLAPALEINHLSVHYGVIRAVQDVTLEVPSQGVIALIGANGAGKSSILRAVAGAVGSNRGSIRVNGVDISSLPTRSRVMDHGVVLVPEGRSVFTTMTVRENLELGMRVGAHRQSRGAAASFGLGDVHELFPVLRERSNKRAQYLSGGEQQMLAISRSLLMSPALLLIDEPSMGLAPLLVRRIFAVMAEVFVMNKVSVLLVEQDTKIALEIAEFAYLLERGVISVGALSAELREDKRLKIAYLGAAVATPLDSSHKDGRQSK